MSALAFRQRALAALRGAALAALIAPCGSSAFAGEVADKAAQAEQLLSAGDAHAAQEAFDLAAAGFWAASPLQLRALLFADTVEGFGKYQPRADQNFHAGDTLLLYLEPTGYGFTPDGENFRIALAADIEIRTQSGLILAKSEDFGRLEWSARVKTHEVHATLAFPLPTLKPGDYQLLLTLRDQGSDKSATATLPFAVAE